MASDVSEILIASQHHKVVTDADLGQWRVDRSHLNAAATTFVAYSGSFDVVVYSRHDHGNVGKVIDDTLPIARPRPPMERLL